MTKTASYLIAYTEACCLTSLYYLTREDIIANALAGRRPKANPHHMLRKTLGMLVDLYEGTRYKTLDSAHYNIVQKKL